MKIQPGYDVLSLFGVPSNVQALTKKSNKNSNTNFIITLVGAFLIVLMFGFASNVVTQKFSVSSVVASDEILLADSLPTAHQPGQFVSQKIGQGYLGGYR